MKYFFPSLIAMILIAAALDSCSQSAGPPELTTLIHTKTRFPASRVGDTLRSFADTNIYNFALSCSCGFEFVVEDADTSSILYNVGNIAVRDASHKIKAFARSGLTAGTYTGWLAVRTLKPDTQEDFRDTLRDTAMIP